MAMDKTTMANAIKAGFVDATVPAVPATAMSEFSAALKTYIEGNAVFTFSWVAALPVPPFTPDPIVTYTGNIAFAAFSIANPSNMAAFGPLITTAVVGGLVNPDIVVPPFVVPPLSLLPVPMVITQSGLTDQQLALEAMSDEIITGIKAMINPAPLAGTHLPYVSPPTPPGAVMTGIT